jgi:hypothetical protein
VSQIAGTEGPYWYIEARPFESYVTFNTGNRILGALFVRTTTAESGKMCPGTSTLK